jgi:hypothetical protein
MDEVVEAVSCDCCGLEEECTGDYIGGVRAYFGGRWLCGLCSEAVKYEAGKCAAGTLEEAVRAHMAICRTLKSGGPAGRVAAGMRQMLRTASVKRRRRGSTTARRLCPSGSDLVAVGSCAVHASSSSSSRSPHCSY